MMAAPRFTFLFVLTMALFAKSLHAFAFSSWTRPSTFVRRTEVSIRNAKSESNEETAMDDNNINEVTETKSDSSNDILNSPAFLKRKLEVLQSDIAKVDADIEIAKEKLEAGKAEWASQLEDLAKEYKNIQQRMNDQNSKSDDQAVMQVARQMLDVLDNFDRAFGQVAVETESEQSIKDEYQTVYDMILATFKRLGVEEIECVGKEFDYSLHQAVMQKPSEQYEEGIVCEEFQKGFKIGDTLIRASMVAVAA